MNRPTRKVLCVFVCCLLVGVIHSNAASSYDISALANFLKYVDDLIKEVLALLESYRPTHPGPIDCSQIFSEGHTKSGIYRIWPRNWQVIGSFQVYCDMETDGGGWTVIQRRGDYKQPIDYFYKTWNEYKMGFGKLQEDFWLGNDRIFSLTDQGNYSLRINLADKEGEKRYAVYQEFWIENDKQLYKLHTSRFSGDAGDSFSDLNGMRFSTKDMDNDAWVNNCAQTYKGAWWYSICHSSNLNGLYYNGYHNTFADGVNWRTWKGYNYSLTTSVMEIRPV